MPNECMGSVKSYEADKKVVRLGKTSLLIKIDMISNSCRKLFDALSYFQIKISVKCRVYSKQELKEIYIDMFMNKLMFYLLMQALISRKLWS